ncbi:HTH-type transcriptional repressor PurR [Streptomyces antimycoticus]
MVTLAEVARHAGVSASTVSYVLSGKRSISAPTRERVEHSIKELGYHPNAGARALASSRSNILALMVPLRTDMYVPVMMEIAIAVASAEHPDSSGVPPATAAAATAVEARKVLRPGAEVEPGTWGFDMCVNPQTKARSTLPIRRDAPTCPR